MRILLWHEDTREPGKGGGAESMLRDLTEAFKRLGHEVAWLHTEHIEQACKQFQPDVVQIGTIFHRMRYDSPQSLRDNHIPHVWAIMNYYPFCWGQQMLKHGDEECGAVTGACDGVCAEGRTPAIMLDEVNKSPVLALNEVTADIYRRNGMRVDYVAELGIDTDLFKPDPAERNPDELQVYTSSAWAAFPAKGMRYLKQAIEQTPYKVKLMTNLTREQVALGLKRADIYIFPSVYEETWGLCLTEAMASGCACITTDNAGGRAQVTDGVNGLIVPKRDANAIRDAVMLLAGDKQLRERLGSAAREHVLADHTLEAMGKRYIAIYEQEMARR